MSGNPEETGQGDHRREPLTGLQGRVLDDLAERELNDMTPTQIAYPRLRELLAHGAQLVEVLPPPEYDQLHLPQAISVPLKTLDADATADLDRTKPVIVYCWDGL